MELQSQYSAEKTAHVKKRSGLKTFFVTFFLLLIILAAAFIWWKYSFTYSDGYRSGLLQKVSHKGNLVKTYEGELVLSSITSAANTTFASEKFYFFRYQGQHCPIDDGI